MDDIIVYGRQWTFVVAILALRMDRLRDFGYLYMYDWTHWCNISHPISGSDSGVIRHMGFSLASVQQGSHGVYLVRCPVLDWRFVVSLMTPRTPL